MSLGGRGPWASSTVKLAAGLAVVVLAGLAALIWWNPCVRPAITVANESSTPVTEVVISGVGFTEALGAIEPGQSSRKSVTCGAESDLKVSFKVAGTPYAQDDLAYIESCGGYQVVLTIKPDHSVGVAQQLGY